MFFDWKPWCGCINLVKETSQVEVRSGRKGYPAVEGGGGSDSANVGAALPYFLEPRRYGLNLVCTHGNSPWLAMPPVASPLAALPPVASPLVALQPVASPLAAPPHPAAPRCTTTPGRRVTENKHSTDVEYMCTMCKTVRWYRACMGPCISSPRQ